MKNFSLIFLITLVLLIFVNILVVLTWPIYSKLNANKHFYIEEQVELLNLSEDELVELHNNTWKNYDKFRFIPFLGHTETDRENKFVNFTEKNGRHIVRPSNCKNNIYLYGGSTTFGYNVTDNQTLGFYLQKLVDNSTCVFNHGRAYYYSKQENNLFINHIENNKKINTAIFLDGINERCGGYEYMNQINNSFNMMVERPYLMWKSSIINLFYTLPIVQFINSFSGSSRWIKDDNNNILKIDSCSSNTDLKSLYEKRVSVRDGICNKHNIKCYSFLQPMVGSSGKQISKLITEERKKDFIYKYEVLSKAKGIIDLKYILINDRQLSYIDGVHYSPDSNKSIAKELFKLLNE